MTPEILIGYDPREKLAYDVLEYSIRRRASVPVKVTPIVLQGCRDMGLFWRDFETRDGKIYDVISDAPCATEFSLTRFLVPYLTDSKWALFCDCDMLARCDIKQLFDLADDKYAIMVTKHVHIVDDGSVKMDNQVQTSYSRKNWSSMMLWNTEHPSNNKLTLDMINSVRGRDLHNFCWLKDEEIGSIPLSYNHLVGYPKPITGDGIIYPAYDYGTPKIVHYTEGMPFMRGYEDCEYADEWFQEKWKMYEDM